MNAFVNTLRLLALVLPAVIELVKALEGALPMRKIGSDKLRLLTELVTEVYNSAGEELRKGVSLSALIKIATAVANRCVELFNRLGWPSPNPAAQP